MKERREGRALPRLYFPLSFSIVLSSSFLYLSLFFHLLSFTFLLCLSIPFLLSFSLSGGEGSRRSGCPRLARSGLGQGGVM